MSPSLRKEVPPQLGQAAPGGSSSSTGRVNQASAPWARNRSRKWRTDSAVSHWVWQVVQPRAGIGTPQDRCRLMHQSGPERHHGLDPRLAPVRQPMDALDRLERPAAQVVVVHADEPLLGGPEDHRLLASPAVGIAVHQRLLVIQVARLLQPGDDHLVGGEDLLAGQPVGRSAVNRPDSSTGLRIES